MKTNIFFKNLTHAGLALAAALFLGIGLASCSKDKNKSKPQPEPEGITLTTNVEIEKTIVLLFDSGDEPKVEGADVVGPPAEEGAYKKIEYKLKAQTLIIKGKVTRLKIEKCGLTALNVTKTPGLIELSVNNNRDLKQLDLRENKKLLRLYASSCGFSELDISKNIALERLFCDNIGLKELDASNNPKLSDINCCNNKLSDETLILLPYNDPKHPNNKGSLLFKKVAGDTQKLSKKKVAELENGNWDVKMDSTPPVKYDGED